MTINIHVIKCDGPPISPPTLEGQHWINTTSGQTWLAVGTSSVSDWILVNESDQLITATVPASTTSDLDIIPLTSLCTVKYIVCVFSAAQNKWKSFEMLGSKVTAVTVSDAIYAVLGSSLDVDFDFSVDGTDAKLIMTNNESFNVSVKIHKNLF